MDLLFESILFLLNLSLRYTLSQKLYSHILFLGFFWSKSAKHYSETLELSWNIEPNRTESNSIELVRISPIEPNRIFSIFRCFFEFGSIEPNS